MLSALLLSVVLGPGFQATSAEFQPGARIELVAQIGESRLLAVNPSERLQLLVFGAVHGGTRTGVLLPPGGEFESRFPSAALSDLVLEIVTIGGGFPTTSGGFSMATLRDERFDALLVETSPRGVLAWGQHGGNLQLLSPGFSLTTLVAKSSSSAVDPLHVPVITPAGKKTGDLPPRMEKKPLPPM